MSGQVWSVRMRAEGEGGRHISGAEGLYEPDAVEGAVAAYTRRALGHPRGEPARVVLTVEAVEGEVLGVAALPVRTIGADGPGQALGEACRLLLDMGVGQGAIDAALGLYAQGVNLGGAALLGARSGLRLDAEGPGVRVSRLGMESGARAAIADQFGKAAIAGRFGGQGVRVQRIAEALTIASKVASAPGVVGELCISDDPDYTTGYVAGVGTGYVRIENMKGLGSESGLRAIFVREGADMERLVLYLTRMPVLVR